MKNKLGLTLIGALTLVLAGCNLLPLTQENKTTGETDVTMEKPLSDETDLDTVEEELNETQVQDYTPELNTLDQEINKL
ncbi:MAG TPA: hypothetical protein VJ242_00450 [Patescibacteria group bacterium]|nr:hypothetical protein [Patescibacteria group bacterium]